MEIVVYLSYESYDGTRNGNSSFFRADPKCWEPTISTNKIFFPFQPELKNSLNAYYRVGKILAKICTSTFAFTISGQVAASFECFAF